MLNIGFLALTKTAFDMTKCTAQPDGTLLLDAAPSLVCNEPWYQPWYEVALAMCVLYAGGVPCIIAIILFVMRPLNNTIQYGIVRLPPSWMGYSYDYVHRLRKTRETGDVRIR